MAIPTQTEMFHIVLELMSDGAERSRRGMKDYALERLGISGVEAVMKTDSGVPVYESRVGWAVSYLARAGLLARVRRGVYAITDEGRKALGLAMSAEEFGSYLQKRIAEINPWGTRSAGDAPRETAEGTVAAAEPTEQVEASPQEQINALADELNDALAQELIDLIMDRDPAFFEGLVVDLLERMGYGKGIVTKRSGDGGIDGLVTTDELGFRPICTQAKRYAADNKVGRAMVQAFVGALNGAPNGVFITTSSFTGEAIEYAQGYPGATLALIDGRHLAELMIKYGLGVSTESVVEIKRVDLDYFEDQ